MFLFNKLLKKFALFSKKVIRQYGEYQFAKTIRQMQNWRIAFYLLYSISYLKNLRYFQKKLFANMLNTNSAKQFGKCKISE